MVNHTSMKRRAYNLCFGPNLLTELEAGIIASSPKRVK